MRQIIILAAALLFSCAPKQELRMPKSGEIIMKNPETTHEEATFNGAGGLKLYQQSWHPKTEPKATVVIMHGLKDYSGHYQELAESLVKSGYAVYAFDLRGHGRSEGRRVFIRSFDEYIDDLSTFVAIVQKREAGRPLFVFGHSMGGAIVTRYALTKKPNIQGVLLSGAALQVGSDVSSGLVKVTRFLGKLFPKLPVLELEDASFSRDQAVVKAMATDPLIYHKKGPARTAAELLKTINATQGEMESFAYPVLIMHGTKDKLTNPEGSKALYQRASSSDKTLKLYDGLFHDLVHEPEKANVIADITQWLDARR